MINHSFPVSTFVWDHQSTILAVTVAIPLAIEIIPLVKNILNNPSCIKQTLISLKEKTVNWTKETFFRAIDETDAAYRKRLFETGLMGAFLTVLAIAPFFYLSFISALSTSQFIVALASKAIAKREKIFDKGVEIFEEIFGSNKDSADVRLQKMVRLTISVFSIVVLALFQQILSERHKTYLNYAVVGLLHLWRTYEAMEEEMGIKKIALIAFHLFSSVCAFSIPVLKDIHAGSWIIVPSDQEHRYWFGDKISTAFFKVVKATVESDNSLGALALGLLPVNGLKTVSFLFLLGYFGEQSLGIFIRTEYVKHFKQAYKIFSFNYTDIIKKKPTVWQSLLFAASLQLLQWESQEVSNDVKNFLKGKKIADKIIQEKKHEKHIQELTDQELDAQLLATLEEKSRRTKEEQASIEAELLALRRGVA